MPVVSIGKLAEPTGVRHALAATCYSRSSPVAVALYGAVVGGNDAVMIAVEYAERDMRLPLALLRLAAVGLFGAFALLNIAARPSVGQRTLKSFAFDAPSLPAPPDLLPATADTRTGGGLPRGAPPISSTAVNRGSGCHWPNGSRMISAAISRKSRTTAVCDPPAC